MSLPNNEMQNGDVGYSQFYQTNVSSDSASLIIMASLAAIVKM
jgi:hypothetical protein